MHLVDSHCHIHDTEFVFADNVLEQAYAQDVRQLVCIGTSGEDSERAVAYAETKPGVFASVGLHPHDAKLGEDDLETIARLAGMPKVVAIGEFGLDYHYNNSPRADQISALEYQLQMSVSFRKPCVFHVREAFDDFWSVLDNFSGYRGVIHSFTSNLKDAEEAKKRGLLLGINGIATFSKDQEFQQVLRTIDRTQILLETDAPFLTPAPLRGTMNVPANVRLVAACLAKMRGELFDELIEATTQNAQMLFALPKSELLIV